MKRFTDFNITMQDIESHTRAIEKSADDFMRMSLSHFMVDNNGQWRRQPLNSNTIFRTQQAGTLTITNLSYNQK